MDDLNRRLQTQCSSHLFFINTMIFSENSVINYLTPSITNFGIFLDLGVLCRINQLQKQSMFCDISKFPALIYVTCGRTLYIITEMPDIPIR